MPTYKLQNNGTDLGHIGVTNAGGTPTWTYNAKGDSGPPVTMSPQPVFTSSNGTSTVMNPAPGDTLNLGTFQGNGTQSFPGNGTYANAVPNGNKAGYYHTASLTGVPGDWDASDSGSGK